MDELEQGLREYVARLEGRIDGYLDNAAKATNSGEYSGAEVWLSKSKITLRHKAELLDLLRGA